MSSIRLLKDYPPHKAGEIISVPFGLGKDLFARGIGEYPEQPKTEAPADSSGEIKRVKDEAQAAMKQMEQEHALEIEALQKQITALTAERDELAKKKK